MKEQTIQGLRWGALAFLFAAALVPALLIGYANASDASPQAPKAVVRNPVVNNQAQAAPTDPRARTQTHVPSRVENEGDDPALITPWKGAPRPAPPAPVPPAQSAPTGGDPAAPAANP